MRSNKILLMSLRDNIDYLRTGLCFLAWELFPEKEYEKIRTYIRLHAPTGYCGKYYRWPKGDKESRLKWLNEQIEKL